MLRVVGCACGNPQIGTDMLLAAEAWQGEPTAFRIDESWEKVDSLFAVRLIEAFSNNPITRREITHMADAHLLKFKKQLPGLCMWIVIEKSFRKSKLHAIKVSMEPLKFCTYSGKGGIVALKDFLSRFRIVMNTIIEAGGKTDDFVVTDAFEREFTVYQR